MKGPLIVPDDRDDADERELPQEVPSRRTRELIRLASAAMVLVASLVGLAAHFIRDPSRVPAPAAGPKAPHFVFGDLHAGRPRGALSQQTWVCTDQVRRDPTGGPWLCVGWQQVELGSQAAAAAASSGRCSNRTVDQQTGWWKCNSRKKLVTYGGLTAVRRDLDTGIYGACLQERRANPTHGAWHCVIWNELPDWMPIHEPHDSGKPCMQRVANQDTGRWDCYQRSRTSVTPLPGPRNAYRGIG
jgi:hypothetical protein